MFRTSRNICHTSVYSPCLTFRIFQLVATRSQRHAQLPCPVSTNPSHSNFLLLVPDTENPLFCVLHKSRIFFSACHTHLESSPPHVSHRSRTFYPACHTDPESPLLLVSHKSRTFSSACHTHSEATRRIQKVPHSFRIFFSTCVSQIQNVEASIKCSKQMVSEKICSNATLWATIM